MEVILIKPPRECSIENSESLALGYLASALSVRGKQSDTEIINAALMNEPVDSVVEKVLERAPTLVGINVADPTLWEGARLIAEQLRQCGYTGHICLGGHTPTFQASDILDQCQDIDSVARFEGEQTIQELLAALVRGSDWRVPGLAHRGSLIMSYCDRQPIENLDEIPFPDRSDLPYVLEHMPETGAVPVLSSRGCYFKCSFCSVRAFYEQDGKPTWRRRSIENVLDEVQDLITTYAVADILFVDDLFISKSGPTLQYARDFAERILDRGLVFTSTLSATVDSVEHETFEMLKEAGLRQVYLGAESASPEILKYLNKWFTPDKIERAVNELDALDLDASVSFINFTPATRLEHLRENVRFFRRLGTNILQGLLNRYQVYGGTPLYETLRAQGRLVGTFPHQDYVGEHDNVELVYAICKRNFGRMLDLADALKRLERRTQIPAIVRSGTDEEWEERKRHRLSKREPFRDMRRGVCEDSADLFEKVLDFVEGQMGFPHAADRKRFEEEIRNDVERTCNGWIKTLRVADELWFEQRTPAIV